MFIPPLWRKKNDPNNLFMSPKDDNQRVLAVIVLAVVVVLVIIWLFSPALGL